MRRVILLIALATSALAASAPVDSASVDSASVDSGPVDSAGLRIVGEWRGVSLCTNRERAPACRDESVRYVFTGPIVGRGTYHLVAEKWVAGSFSPMGEIDLAYARAADEWTYAFETRNCSGCVWWYRVDGNHLIGGLTSAGDTLRKVSARRVDPPPRR